MGYLSKDEYSKNSHAVAVRTARLLNDKIADKHAEASRDLRKRAQKNKVQAKAKQGLLMGEKTHIRLPRVKHHLSKGRGASDIAVREGWLVSDVVKLIDMVEAKG